MTICYDDEGFTDLQSTYFMHVITSPHSFKKGKLHSCMICSSLTILFLTSFLAQFHSELVRHHMAPCITYAKELYFPMGPRAPEKLPGTQRVIQASCWLSPKGARTPVTH